MNATGLSVAVATGTALFAALAFVLALTLGLSVASGDVQRAGDIEVREVFIYETLPGRATGAAYLRIANRGTVPVRLTGATFPGAGTVELHTMAMDGDVMRMRRIEGGIPLAPGASHVMRPGGDHVMLMDLEGPLGAGESHVLTLIFDGHPPVAVSAPVVAR